MTYISSIIVIGGPEQMSNCLRAAKTAVFDAPAGPVASAPGFLLIRPFDEGGVARALERAPAASEARMAKRSGRAVNEGLGRPK